MGSKAKFKKIFELAQLLSGEVGATRPIVYAGWAGDDTLIGQAGKHIKPPNPGFFFPSASAAPFSTQPPLPTPTLSSPSIKTPMPP
jgi:hypothetical protein